MLRSLLGLCLLVLYSCGSQSAATESAAVPTTLRWVPGPQMNLGSQRARPVGDTLRFTFKSVNTGEAPLFIREVRASCGCTVPQYTRTAVAPGDTAFVHMAVGVAGRSGMTNKSLDVFCNTEPDHHTLSLKAVLP
jgi:Protein of unknown function (DUF1573)